MKVALFGSFAKGEEGKRSDIDILIKYQKGSDKSLLDLIRLQFELEDKLGRKVDLLTYGDQPFTQRLDTESSRGDL